MEAKLPRSRSESKAATGIQRELEAKRAEKHALTRLDTDNTTDLAHGKSHLGELRGVDKR